MDEGPGELQGDSHFGAVVLDGLVGPHRPAELLPVGHVGHGQVQEPLGHADGLGGGRPGAAVHATVDDCRIVGQQRVGCRRPVHAGQAAGPVHALLFDAGQPVGGYGVECTIGGQQDQVGLCGGRDKLVDRRGNGHDRVAGGRPSKPLPDQLV